jgi:hypothetical protein
MQHDILRYALRNWGIGSKVPGHYADIAVVVCRCAFVVATVRQQSVLTI